MASYAVKLTDIQKGQLFRQLATKTTTVVAYEFGFDKRFPSVDSMRKAVHRIQKEVAENPEQFGVDPSLAQQIMEIVKGRQGIGGLHNVSNLTTLREKETLETLDVKELVERGTRKGLVLLNKKLDKLMIKPSQFDKVGPGELAKVMGILFDKRQISRGEATEHIAIRAKVSHDLTPQQKFELLMKLREQNSNNE